MKKKLLKIVSTSTLAVIMGAGVLCGTIIPINSGGSAAATMTSQNPQSGQQAFHNASGAATQENLVAGEAIQLNPQTDETIFTTESGFEIKSHTVAGQTLANSKVQYFTLGSYNGTPLNWIILAGSPTIHTDSTPAGTAITNDASKQTISLMTDSKLSANQMLVISEKVIPVSTYTFSVTPKTGTTTGSVPADSESGSGWTKGSYSHYCIYYASLLVNDASKFYTSGPTTQPNFNSTVNSWFTGGTLGLSNYCGTAIVKNSNFNSNYYAFNFSNSLLTTYLPSAVRAAKDLNGTARNYWLDHSIVGTRTENFSYASTPYNNHTGYYTTGSAAYTFNGYVVNGSGTVETTLLTITATIGKGSTANMYSRYRSGGAYHRSYAFYATATFTHTGQTSITGYYRPAMVIDISKF